MKFETRSLLGKTIEEVVLACPTYHEETLQFLAAVQRDAIENLRVLCGETVKDETREDGSVVGRSAKGASPLRSRCALMRCGMLPGE